jgi:hypothetical protein
MATGLDGRWYPGIGDPTLRGWLTVGAYALGAALALRAAWVSARHAEPSLAPADQRHLVVFWCLTAVVLILLGINKQLDLQTWLTEMVRDLAMEHGWYGARRQYQILFIGGIASIGLISTLTAAVLLRRVLVRIGIALLGLGVLIAFVVARAASFHHMDTLLNAGPFALNWWAEFGGIALIVVNAWAAGKYASDKPQAGTHLN